MIGWPGGVSMIAGGIKQINDLEEPRPRVEKGCARTFLLAVTTGAVRLPRQPARRHRNTDQRDLNAGAGPGSHPGDAGCRD